MGHRRFIAYFQKARRIRIACSLYSISPLVDLFMFFIEPRTRRRRFNGRKYVWWSYQCYCRNPWNLHIEWKHNFNTRLHPSSDFCVWNLTSGIHSRSSFEDSFKEQQLSRLYINSKAHLSGCLVFLFWIKSPCSMGIWYSNPCVGAKFICTLSSALPFNQPYGKNSKLAWPCEQKDQTIFQSIVLKTVFFFFLNSQQLV